MDLKIGMRVDLVELSSKTASTMPNKAWKGLNRQFFAAGASSSSTCVPQPHTHRPGAPSSNHHWAGAIACWDLCWETQKNVPNRIGAAKTLPNKICAGAITGEKLVGKSFKRDAVWESVSQQISRR